MVDHAAPARTGRLSSTRALGQAGEDRAARWYWDHGYVVVERNWRCRTGEIDLIAVKADLTVFCEVKARASSAYGFPAEAVGPVKQLRARRLAAAWFASRPPLRGQRRGGPVRFDVATFMSGRLEVIEAAF